MDNVTDPLEHNTSEGIHYNSSSGMEEGRTTGLYVDVENLLGGAQSVIRNLIDEWSPPLPKPQRLNLYVRADQTLLWELWAGSQFPEIKVSVRGVQHFSAYSSKNSADIALAIDAISDLLLGEVGHIAVLSDDSDFIALYAKLREVTSEKRGNNRSHDRVPFLWLLTDRDGTRSSTIKEYFPNDYVRVVRHPGGGQNDSGSSYLELTQETSSPDSSETEVWEEMAVAIIQNIPVGQFKSTDTQKIIKGIWPSQHIANADGPSFGTQFYKNIWPLLRARGVTEPNPNKKPRKFEMTEKAKTSVH